MPKSQLPTIERKEENIFKGKEQECCCTIITVECPGCVFWSFTILSPREKRPVHAFYSLFLPIEKLSFFENSMVVISQQWDDESMLGTVMVFFP